MNVIKKGIFYTTALSLILQHVTPLYAMEEEEYSGNDTKFIVIPQTERKSAQSHLSLDISLEEQEMADKGLQQTMSGLKEILQDPKIRLLSADELYKHMIAYRDLAGPEKNAYQAFLRAYHVWNEVQGKIQKAHEVGALRTRSLEGSSFVQDDEKSSPSSLKRRTAAAGSYVVSSDPEVITTLKEKLKEAQTNDPNFYSTLSSNVTKDTLATKEQEIASIDQEMEKNIKINAETRNQSRSVMNINYPDPALEKLKKEKEVVEEDVQAIKEIQEERVSNPPIIIFDNIDKFLDGTYFINIVNMICSNEDDTTPISDSPSSVTLPSSIDEVEEDENVEDENVEDEETKSLKDKQIKNFLIALKKRQVLTTEQKEMFNKVSSELMKEMRRIKNAFKHKKGPLVLFVGETGSGKTTLVHLLTGTQLEAKKDRENENNIILDSLREKTEIGHGVASKTIKPDLRDASQSDLIYADCPGFNDTRGILQKIKNALYIHELFRDRGEAIRFVIVEPADSFGTMSRGQHFISTLKALKNTINNLSIASVSLVVTQHDNRFHKSLSNLKDHMIRLANTEEDPEIKVLLEGFTGENKITLFSRPTVEGPYSNNIEKEEILNIIKTIIPLSLNYKKDVRISLPQDAQDLINVIKNGLIHHMLEQIDSQIVQKITSYYTKRIKSFCSEVDKILETAMQRYTPYIFALRAPRKNEQDFNEKTEAHAVNNRNQFVGILGGGIVAGGALGAAATGAVLTLLSGGIFAWASGSSVLTGALVYYIKKRFWKQEVLSGIKKTKGEELRLEFSNLEREVRKAKFGLGDHSKLLTTEGIFEKIYLNENDSSETKRPAGLDKIDFSKIKKTASSLDCIYRINGDHSTCFAEDIWHPTFSKLEETLRGLTHQSGEDFYDNSALKPLTGTAPKSTFIDLSPRLKEKFPLRVGLSIDGGGIRGLMPAFYLNEIESLSRKTVCQLFDAVGGTSIGGILGLGLVVPDTYGQPYYQAKDLLDLLRTQGGKIFSVKTSSFQEVTYNKVRYTWKARYSPKPLEEILFEKFKNNSLTFALRPIVIPALQIDGSDYIFNSWQEDAKNSFYMRDVARATSAAPSYFPAATISRIFDNIPLTLVDGGIWHNNPSEHVYNQLQKLYPNDKYTIVSLGTGFGPTQNLPKDSGTLELASPLIETLMFKNEQGIDGRMNSALGDQYVRIQVDLGEQIELDVASDDAINLLEVKSEEKLRDLEDVTRFLLMNDDAWKDVGGRDLLSQTFQQ